MRLVEVDDGVELVSQAGIEVVGDTLGLRPVDDADRATVAVVPQSGPDDAACVNLPAS
jgi:hypothetical protein